MKSIGLAGALLVTMSVLSMPASAQFAIGVSVRLAPPPLPIYAQPPLPGADFLWTPGYWAWDDDAAAYFWVPGTWVRAPRPGLLWTPPWWGWSNGFYAFHSGYWGQHIGFYGGVPYGFGYTGFGYQGGYWNGGHVFYNRTVNNITNVNVTNVYQTNVIVNRMTRASYNGGPGGVQARPRPEEQQAATEQHVAATGGQQAHFAAAHADPQAFAPANHGRPPLLATPRPLGGPGAAARRENFSGPVVRSEGGAVAPSATGDRAVSAEQAKPLRDGLAGSPRPQAQALGEATDQPVTIHRGQRTPLAADAGNAGDPTDRQAPHPGPHPAPHQPPHPHPHPKPAAPHPHSHPQGHHDDHHR